MIKLLDTDQWEEIFDSLTRNKARTFLTAFGIFWGIFMLVLLMGGGKGLQSTLASNFAGFASNSGFMASSATSEPYKGFAKGRIWKMKIDDAKRIMQCVPEVELATPTITSGGEAKYKDNSTRINISGIFTEYDKVDDPKIKQGRSLNDVDILQARKVCVIGSRIVEELFPGDVNPCGKFIDIDGVFYQIVGISGKSANGINVTGNATRNVRMPYTTMQLMQNRGENVDVMCMVAKEQYKMSEVQDKVETHLKRIHLINPKDTQAIFKFNAEAIFSMIDGLFKGVSILVWMIGLGTLIAGAIGVSNIMVVTVKERTTEIGIRRAIGATPKDILTMIMSESIILTLTAGMSGIVFAVLILQLLEVGIDEPGAHFQITFGLAIGAAMLLSLLGLIAGLAPALRAMNIKPVDAMREE